MIERSINTLRANDASMAIVFSLPGEILVHRNQQISQPPPRWASLSTGDLSQPTQQLFEFVDAWRKIVLNVILLDFACYSSRTSTKTNAYILLISSN